MLVSMNTIGRGDLRIEGRIFRDADGILVSRCESLDISTCGETFEDVVRSTVDMLVTYFEASQKLGRMPEVMRMLAGDALADVPREIEACFVAPDVAGVEVRRTIRL